jgi:hypothetical protein
MIADVALSQRWGLPVPILLLIYLLLTVYAGIHLVRTRGANGWLLAIVFLPFLGSIAYILTVMKPSWPVPRPRPADIVHERGPYAREYRDPAESALDLARRHLDEREPQACRQVLDGLDLRRGSRLNAEAELLRARCLEAEGHRDEALAAYKELMESYPGEEARCRYALLLRELGRFDEARDMFRDVARSVAKGGRDYLRSEGEWLALAKRHLGL